MLTLKRILPAGTAILGLMVLSILLFAGCSGENPVGSEGSLAPGSAPDVVLAAANKAVPGGEVTGVDEEEEGGQTIYEVQKKVDGVEYEIEVTADGEVLEVEEGGDSWWDFW